MSTKSVTLKYLLLAEDHATKALKNYGSEVDQAGKKTSGMSTKAKVALAGLGVAAVGFAKSSIDKFKQVTSESRTLQRALGGTLEEASRFREEAILSGVDTATFTKSAQKLDKTLVAAAKSTKTSADMTKLLGFNFKDAHGKVLPMAQLLPKLSDTFANMPDGPEKTALAMQLFGKAGAQMLPFLGKGSAGLAELGKESDKFGTTLNEGAIDALSKSKEQSREFTAAMDGLKVQIGAQLLPIMNKLIGFIQSFVLPAFQKASTFVREHQHLIGFLAAVIGGLVLGLKAWAIIQAVLNAELWANPIGIVIVAIAALAAGIIYAYKKSATFRAILQGVWDFLKQWGPAILALFLPVIGIPLLIWQHWSQIKAFMLRVWNTVWPYLKTWGPVALAVLVPFIGIPLLIWQHFSKIKGWLSGLWDSVVGRAKAFVSAVSGVFKKIGDGLKWAWDHTLGPIIDAIVAGIQNAIDLYNSLPGTHGTIAGHGSYDPSLNPSLPGAHKSHRAAGGDVRAGMPYIVHDSSVPEIFVPGSDGHIFPRVSIDNGDAAGKVDTSGLERKLDAILTELRRGGDVYLDDYKVGVVTGRRADRYARGG